MWAEFLAAAACCFVMALAVAFWRTRSRLAESLREQGDLARSSHVFDEERRVLQLIAKGASLGEVLDALTQAIERMAPECFCSVLLLDDEGRRLLKGSGGSLPAPYIAAVHGLAIGP